MIQKESILEWIADYPARLIRGLKAFPPKVQVADRHIEYFNDVAGQNEEANRDWMENSDGPMDLRCQRQGEDLRIAIEHAEACVEAMSDEPGPWQRNNTSLFDSVLKIMRDPWSTEKIASWPAGRTNERTRDEKDRQVDCPLQEIRERRPSAIPRPRDMEGPGCHRSDALVQGATC